MFSRAMETAWSSLCLPFQIPRWFFWLIALLDIETAHDYAVNPHQLTNIDINMPMSPSPKFPAMAYWRFRVLVGKRFELIGLDARQNNGRLLEATCSTYLTGAVKPIEPFIKADFHGLYLISASVVCEALNPIVLGFS